MSILHAIKMEVIKRGYLCAVQCLSAGSAESQTW